MTSTSPTGTSTSCSTIADEIETALSVGPLPGPVPAASEVLHRGAERLGWRNDEIPRWMTYPDGQPGVRQSMTRTYLPRAADAGARLLVGHRVERIERRGAGATGVRVRGAAGATTVKARYVFVCGGAIQTPALLQRSGLARRHRPHARRPPDGQARRPLPGRGQRR